MATRVDRFAEDSYDDSFDDSYGESVDDYPADGHGIDRDDIIFLVFALLSGGLLALYYAPLGLVTFLVFAVAAWVRRRHAVARWTLTLVAILGVLGVLALTMTS
ncbi:hypothetical protein ACFQX7_04255 [Luedemannella flava]